MYRKIPKISPGAYNYFSKSVFEGLNFGGAYTRSGLSTEGNLRFKIDCASLIVGRKFTIFALYLRAVFQLQAPRGTYIWRGDLTEGFLRCEFGGLIFGGAYFRNFAVYLLSIRSNLATSFEKQNHKKPACLFRRPFKRSINTFGDECRKQKYFKDKIKRFGLKKEIEVLGHICFTT